MAAVRRSKTPVGTALELQEEGGSGSDDNKSGSAHKSIGKRKARTWTVACTAGPGLRWST
jgi:hypothetical protein